MKSLSPILEYGQRVYSPNNPPPVGSGGLTFAATAPTIPHANGFWWNSTIGGLYVQYNDGTTTQWVLANQKGANGTNGSNGTNSTSVTGMLKGNGTSIQLAVAGIDYGVAGVPITNISTAYTALLQDANTGFLHPAADTTARTWTINSNAAVAYPIGTALSFINQNGAGVITIAITTDTMRLAGTGLTGNRTLSANGIATALKVTSTEWLISGTGLT